MQCLAGLIGGDCGGPLFLLLCLSVMWGLRNWNLHYQNFCYEGSWCDKVYPIRLEHGRRQKSHSFATAALTVLKFGQEGSGTVCSYFSWGAIIETIVNSHQVLQISSGVGNVDLISQSPYYWQTQKKAGRMAARSLHGKILQTCPCVLSGLWPERQCVLNSDFQISGCMLRLWMCGKHSTIPAGEFPLSHFFITVRIAALLLGYVCSVVWASFLKEWFLAFQWFLQASNSLY